MTERLVSKLHVALLSYDEREIRVRKNYLEEQNPAICCVCFHSGEELLRELRQQRSVDIVVLSSQLEDMDGYEFLKRLNSLHNRPLLLLQGDDWYSDATASFLRPDGRQYLPERSSLLDLLLDARSSTDIGIFWVLPFCKQLYAEWGILQPDVNCEYLTTALQVVCGTERKLAVRKEIPADCGRGTPHHSGRRGLRDAPPDRRGGKIQHRSLAEIQAGLRPDGA